MNRSADRHRGRRDQLARKALEPIVRAGLAVCRRCGQPLPADIPDDEWDAGHLHDLGNGGDPGGPRVPEHASCNRSAGGALAAELRRGRRVDRRRHLRFFG